MEVMVAVAIVALLATMALPSMTNGIVRKQVIDAVPLADIVKSAVAQAWASAAALPAKGTSTVGQDAANASKPDSAPVAAGVSGASPRPMNELAFQGREVF